MRKPDHYTLLRTWDLKTIRENLGEVEDYIIYLKQNGKDATEWETGAADLRDELTSRTKK